MHTNQIYFYLVKNRNGKSTIEKLNGIIDFNVKELKIEKLLNKWRMNKPLPIGCSNFLDITRQKKHNHTEHGATFKVKGNLSVNALSVKIINAVWKI